MPPDQASTTNNCDTMKLKLLLLVAACMLSLWACQKDEGSAPSQPGIIPGTTEQFDATGEGIQLSNPITVPAPSGDAVRSDFDSIALRAFRRAQGDSLTGSTEDRGSCNGFANLPDAKSRIQAHYRQVTLIITAPTNPFDYTTVGATASVWKNTAANSWELALFQGPLQIATLTMYCTVPNGQALEAAWLLDVNQSTGATVDQGDIWYKLQNAAGLGLPTKIHAIVFAHNSLDYALWQLPGVGSTHVFSQLAQETSDNMQPAASAQAMETYAPCFLFNKVPVISMQQSGGFLFITVPAPISPQTVAISNTPQTGWFLVHPFVMIGKEAYPLQDAWATSPLTECLLSLGAKFNTNGTISETTACFK